MTRTEKPETDQQAAPPAAATSPDIAWSDAGAPHSTLFDDMYFNPENGRAESEHVFLHGTGFPERWDSPGRRKFAELGFGLGLNFIATWAQAAQVGGPAEAFDYTAFEIAPPDSSEIRRALAPWPDLTPMAERLCAAWPLADGQWTTLSDHAPGPRLRLFHGDARKTLPALASAEPASIDTLYLDGFSPAKNPEMWDDNLLASLYGLATPGAKAATFTAAGWVKRGLRSAGFMVHKAPGYGRKRERLVAEKPAEPF